MSYGKIGLTTVVVTQDLLAGVPLVLEKNNSFAFGTVYYLNQDNPVTNCPNSYTHCIQEEQAYNKPVVLESLYSMISLLLRHAQGQTLIEF